MFTHILMAILNLTAYDSFDEDFSNNYKTVYGIVIYTAVYTDSHGNIYLVSMTTTDRFILRQRRAFSPKVLKERDSTCRTPSTEGSDATARATKIDVPSTSTASHSEAFELRTADTFSIRFRLRV